MSFGIQLSSILATFFLFFRINSVFQINRNLLILFIALTLHLSMSVLLLPWYEYGNLSLQRSILIVIPSIVLLLSISIEKNIYDIFIAVIKSYCFIVVSISFIAIIVYFFGSINYSGDVVFQVLNIGPISVSNVVFGTSPFLRTGGYFGNPNSLARWIVYIYPFLIAMKLNKDIKNVEFWAYALIATTALMITISRTGIVVLFVSILAFAFVYKRSFTFRALIISVGAMSGVVLLYAYMVIFSDWYR